VDRDKSFAMRTQAQRSNRVGKISGYRLRTPAHRLPKALDIHLGLRRSGELRRIGAGLLGKDLASRRKRDGFASARTNVNGKQTHDSFSILACSTAELPHCPNCRPDRPRAQVAELLICRSIYKGYL
jgi:hypothetical protein